MEFSTVASLNGAPQTKDGVSNTAALEAETNVTNFLNNCKLVANGVLTGSWEPTIQLLITNRLPALPKFWLFLIAASKLHLMAQCCNNFVNCNQFEILV